MNILRKSPLASTLYVLRGTTVLCKIRFQVLIARLWRAQKKKKNKSGNLHSLYWPCPGCRGRNHGNDCPPPPVANNNSNNNPSERNDDKRTIKTIKSNTVNFSPGSVRTMTACFLFFAAGNSLNNNNNNTPNKTFSPGSANKTKSISLMTTECLSRGRVHNVRSRIVYIYIYG